MAKIKSFVARTAVLVSFTFLVGCSSDGGTSNPGAADNASTSAAGATHGTTAPTTKTAASSDAGSRAPASTSKAGKNSTPAHVASGTALALLATLKLKGRAPMTGYSREQFGSAWTDDNDDPLGGNGCRTRDDILARDLTHVQTSDGCKVLSGVLVDPYTGKTIQFRYGVGTSNAVQIDHVVALGDAWQTGAQQWAASKRTDLANDPLNLLAVDGPANESKGDGDAATWLPPSKSYRCAYVARQVAVKARYKLWVTKAEHAAIARILATCPRQKAPTESGKPPAVHPSPVHTTPTHHKPKPKPTKGTGPKVVEFANCTAMHNTYPHGVGLPGAHDHTSGTPDTDYFVSKALYDANAKSDRDKDGIACEA